MTHSSKRKGNTFERELVNQAIAAGIPAERAYASNGKALGEAENVDCKVGGLNVQAKRRRKLAEYLVPDDNVHVQAFRQDRGETYVSMRYELFLELLKGTE